MGGKSAEREVSFKTGQAIIKNLDRKKYTVTGVEMSLRGDFSLPEGTDLVFIALHGPWGEDGTVQGILELKGIPYTGSGVLASALGMNKLVSKALFSQAGLTIPKTFVYQGGGSPALPFGFPCVVKPHNQGSSVGVSVVKNPSSLDKALALALSYFGAKALVEEYLVGKELTCGILGNSGAGPYCLPITEVILGAGHTFFDYRSKYKLGESQEITPTQLTDNERSLVEGACLTAYEALNCRAFARVDGILSQGIFYILEINTIPGMTETSLLPQQAKAAGITFPALLDEIISYSLVV